MGFKSTQDLSEFDKFFKEVEDLSSYALDYGYFDTMHYSGLNMATLAAIHEEGWNGLPERNFIYTTSIAFRKQLEKLNKSLFSDIVIGRGFTPGLTRIGKAGADQIGVTIDMGTFSNPKVSPSWAEVKGHDDALKHYGDLKAAATFKIER